MQYYTQLPVFSSFSGFCFVGSYFAISICCCGELGQSTPNITEFEKEKYTALNIFRTIDHRLKIDQNYLDGITLPGVTGHVELRNMRN